MALFSVNPINFIYKQFNPVPASVLVTISDLTRNDVVFGNLPNWLTISDVTIVDTTTVTALFTINISEANTLTPSNYTVAIDVFSYLETAPPEDQYISEGSISVNLELQETILLSVAPENIIFNYNIGGSLPAPKIIQIISENSWTVVSSTGWINPSVTNGSNNGSVSISVNTSGLSPATHTGTITIDDGSATKVVNVSLLVSNGNTVDDYLYTTPSEIEFVKNIGSTFNPTKTISLNSSDSWTATSSENWLDLDKLSGSSGSDLITISLDTIGLTEGLYTAEITIINGNIIRKTYVSLYLTVSLINVPNDDNLYFSEDDVKLELSTQKENSVLEVDFKAVIENSSILYQKKAPFIKGKASINIGEECINIINPVEDVNFFTSRITTLIKPATLKFTAFEKNYFTNVVYETLERNSLYFLNGKTPQVLNKLSYIPSTITVSNKAVLCFNLFKSISPGVITIEGAVNDSIRLDTSNNSDIYSAFVNLSDYNLKNLDIINVTFDFLKVKVRIKSPEAESILLAFENEWQLPEIIELTGGLVINDISNFSSQKFQKVNEIYEQIYDASPFKKFDIYTGWIESKEEVMWLSKLLNAKKIFLIINNQKIEVIPTFKTFRVYKTREHFKNFKLTFKKALV